MKTLLLLRHAEASGTEAGRRDFDRPLNEHGRQQAVAVGRLLRQRRIEPDRIIYSPAERARQTAALVVEAAGLVPSGLEDDARIYEAGTPTLFEIVSQLEDDARTVLLVGHNPGISDLLAHLTGEDGHLRTAALALVSFDVEEWRGVRAQAGRLEWTIAPEKPA
jgi:phosphohistidine phosphatase